MNRAARRLARVLWRRNAAVRGEIREDELSDHIRKVVADPAVGTILEVGSASGAGSTRGFVEGIEHSGSEARLFCIEVVTERFAELAARYEGQGFVRAYNVSSVSEEGFASEEEVRNFYALVPSALNAFSLEVVLGWRASELAYHRSSGVRPNGIDLIRRENAIDRFDAVLLDGSEFTARAELDLLIGARYVLLDDINSFKNHYNCQRLLVDPGYELLAGSSELRNGYAIFRRRDPRLRTTSR